MLCRTVFVGDWRIFFGAVILGWCGFGFIRHRRSPTNVRGVLALQLGLVYLEANWAFNG